MYNKHCNKGKRSKGRKESLILHLYSAFMSENGKSLINVKIFFNFFFSLFFIVLGKIKKNEKKNLHIIYSAIHRSLFLFSKIPNIIDSKILECWILNEIRLFCHNLQLFLKNS